MDASWQLSVTEDGPREAPVLVLGHALGVSHAMWDGVVPLLAAHLRVLRYDLPGHGGTPPAPVEGPLTMSQLTDALTRTLDARGVDRFHLAGLSLGGLTALCLGEAVPGRVITVSAMSTGPVNLPSLTWWDRARLVRRDGTAPLADATMERWFSPAFRATPDGAAQVERIRASFVSCDPRGYAQCCEVLATADARPGLSLLTMPLLLVTAEDDASFDWQAAETLAAQLRAHPGSDVTVVRVPGARHLSAVERPQLVARALLERVGIAPSSSAGQS